MDDTRIKLSFLGAARNVTGSRYLVQSNGSKVLVDCGLYQEREFRNRNWDTSSVAPGTVDAVLLTHAHLDHCGLLPKFVREGFRGRVFCTGATADIARIVLLDSSRLQEEDARHKRERHRREGRSGPYPEVPLYTEQDAKRVFSLFSPVEYGTPVQICEGIQATFHDAGHILGSSMVRLLLDGAGSRRSIVFSGDLGRWDKPILRDPSLLESADYVCTETTYGGRVHEPSSDLADRLAEIVNSTWKAGGNIVIPSFAVGRTQEILYYLNELLIEDRIPHLMVFIDSPMAVKVTNVFKRHAALYDVETLRLLSERKSPFGFPNLKMVSSVGDSKAINHIRGTAVIIAGSGMCTGGRIKHHLVSNLSRPESTLLFVGYQASGTLGRVIVDGAREVRLFGETYPVRARVARIEGFSAHADQRELWRWLSALETSPRHVFLTHGELESSQAFADYLMSRTDWNVSIPRYRDEVSLE